MSEDRMIEAFDLASGINDEGVRPRQDGPAIARMAGELAGRARHLAAVTGQEPSAQD